MTFATIYVLPCAASLAIVVRSIKAIRPGDSGRPSTAWMSLFIFTMAFSCIPLCDACWRQRPNAKRFRSSLLLKQSKALGAIEPSSRNEKLPSA
jgi:hypothetical protein